MNIQKYRDFELHEVTEGVHAFALTPEACRQARAHRQKSANVAPDHPWCGLWWGITNAGAQKVVDGIWDDSCTTDESARADSEPHTYRISLTDAQIVELAPVFCEMNVEFDPRSCHLAFDDHDSYIGGQYGGPAVIELFNEVLSERGMGSIPDWPLLSSTGRRRVLDLALSTIEFGDNWSVAVPRQLVTRVAELGLVGNGSTTLRAETIQSVEKGVK